MTSKAYGWLGIGAVAAIVTVTVAKGTPAASDVTVEPTTVTLGARPDGNGSRVRLTAAVSFAQGGEVPGGTVEFVDETQHTVLGVTDVSMPWIVVDRLADGPHVFRASYSGVVTYFPFVVDPSASAPLSYADQVTPAVDLSSTQNPSRPGEAVTLTAVVHSSAGIPSGTVKFLDLDRVLADHVRLDSNGAASFTTSALNEGSRRIVAVYEGDARNSAARSQRLAQNVGEAAIAPPPRAGQARLQRMTSP